MHHKKWEAEGQWQRGRLSLHPFFGEAKKKMWLSGHPRPTDSKVTTTFRHTTKIKANPKHKSRVGTKPVPTLRP
jgi:hypothetical protein